MTSYKRLNSDPTITVHVNIIRVKIASIESKIVYNILLLWHPLIHFQTLTCKLKFFAWKYVATVTKKQVNGAKVPANKWKRMDRHLCYTTSIAKKLTPKPTERKNMTRFLYGSNYTQIKLFNHQQSFPDFDINYFQQSFENCLS